MKKAWKIVKREYWERVRKKSFIIVTVLGPLLMAGLVFIPVLLVEFVPGDQKRVPVIDLTGKIYPQLVEGMDYKLKGGRREFLFNRIDVKEKSLKQVEDELTLMAEKGEIYGFLLIGEDIEAKDNFKFFSKNVSNLTVMERIQGALSRVVVGLRLDREGILIKPDRLNELTKGVVLEPIKIGKGGERKKSGFEKEYLSTFLFVMILYMTILLYGVSIMRGIIDEKSSRIVEILLSSVSPFQLMMGKILGIGLVALTQYGIWAVSALLVFLYGSAMGGMIDYLSFLSPTTLIYFVVFFILGYFLFSAIYAGVGAVCNSEQEAQQIQTPVATFLVIPMMLAIFLIQNPESKAAVYLSFFPLFTPMVMFMRINTVTPPFYQILLSIILLVLTLLFLIWVASKVFRLGLLMYGKRPTIPEILRWIRYA